MLGANYLGSVYLGQAYADTAVSVGSTDASGVITEAVALVAKPIAADVNGFSETGTLGAPIAATDSSGVISEIVGSRKAVLTDTGSAADSQSVDLGVLPLAGWYQETNSASALTFEQYAALHTDGSYSAHLQATLTGAGSFNRLRSARAAETGKISVTPGKNYEFAADYYSFVDVSNFKAFISLEWLDAAGATISTKTARVNFLAVGSWQTITVAGTAPASAAYVCIWVDQEAGSFTSNYLVDNTKLVEISEAALVPATDTGTGADSESVDQGIILKDGTDASGVITEVVALAAKPTQVDANGAIAEATTVRYFASSSDANGATTENVGRVAVFTDSATASEISGLASKPTAVDASSTVTEDGSVAVGVVQKSDTDVGGVGVAVTASDNFNRTDAANLGSNWTLVTPTLGGTPVPIVGNAAEIPSGQRAEVWNQATFGADQEVSLTMTAINYNNAFVWLLLQVANPTAGQFTGYLFQIAEAFDHYAITLYRGVSDSYTNLLGVDPVPYGHGGTGIGDVWTLRKVGSTITALLNGSVVSGYPITDPAPLNATSYAGFGGNGTAGTKVDDFLASGGVSGGEVATVTSVASISGSDSNGTTTESGVITAISSTTDASSVTTEAIGNRASASPDVSGVVAEATTLATRNFIGATDQNSITTEAVAMARQVADQSNPASEVIVLTEITTSTDASGATTESASTIAVNAVLSSDANSTTTESITLLASPIAADVGNVIGEVGGTGTIKSDSDTNSATTEVIGSRLIVLSDASAATEAQTEIYRPTSTDSGSATDTQSVLAPTAKSGTDSGTASETASPGFSASGGTDTLSGADVASPRFLCSQSDTSGLVTESATALRTYLVADSGSATDSAQVTQTHSLLDTGTGVDTAQVVARISVFDSNTATTEFTSIAVRAFEVGIWVDMEHALINVGSSPHYAGNLSANGLSRATLIEVTGSTTLLRTRLGKAILRKVT